jgi:L-asparaginase II/GNAT superfamily N-acetyltransferase
VGSQPIQGSDGCESLPRRGRETDPCFEPLLALTRGSVVESLHRGAIAVVDAAGDLLGGVGDPALALHLRSAAKPFQALAVVECGAADAFAMSDEELAVVCGSHAGQPEHVRVVEGLLRRLGVPPSALVCGSLQHMCSGKHAGLVALALHLGAPVAGYEQVQHPVQREISRAVRSLLARRPGQPARRRSKEGRPAGGPIFAGTDGCGVPAVRLSLHETAWLYALLGAGVTPALARIRDVMFAYPGLVAGSGRFDTRVMQTAPGRLVAKGGAEGVEGLALIPGFTGDPGEGAPVGCVIKVEDGSTRPLPSLVTLFLRTYGLEESATTLEHEYPPFITGAGEAETGRLAALVESIDLRRSPPGIVAGDVEEYASQPDLSDTKLVTSRGDDREVLRFLREEWPWADEETFGRPVEWIAEPLVLALRRQRQILGVLKGHFVGGVGSVDELIVRRTQRGLGVGSMMLRRFEEEADRRECRRVVLRAVKGSPAEDFYRRRGYHRESVQCSYEFGYDYVRLTRRLHAVEDRSRGEEGPGPEEDGW